MIFGPKGTGKTRILEAIAKYYSKNGIDASVYESAADKLHEIFDTKGKELSVNLANYGIDPCIEEISILRDCVELEVTSVLKYVAFFETTTTNKNAKKILLQDVEGEDESTPKRTFLEFNNATRKTSEFIDFLTKDNSLAEEFTDQELEEIRQVLAGLLARLEKREWGAFTNWKEVQLLNAAIRKVRLEIERKTGNPAKPVSTGFRDYALNRIGIQLAASKIIRSVETKIPSHSEIIGNLGAKKGNLELQTDLVIQDGRVTDGHFKPLKGVKKSPQKKFVEKVRLITDRAYSEHLFAAVAELNQVDDAEVITSISDLLLCKRFFALEGKPYEPSSGESSMVMLHKELETDKDVYILDEPERSLGNQYISDVIVPLIKQRARANKRVFISTHDANIAVRTLPYCSIYRSYESPDYKTHIGNPFTNDLLNPDDKSDSIDWKKISMTVLEGGEEAFGERRTIYGNH